MTPDELRQSFLSFMEAHGASIVPSASLLPENDPTTLFTGSGMQPMIPYLLGEKHPSGNEVVNVQKCLRTGDIEEIGDSSHLTFFEMAGRWEFSSDPKTYKRTQIELMWEWQINRLGLNPERLYVSVCQGNERMKISRDEESIKIWCTLFKKIGIDPVVEEEPTKYGISRGGRILLYSEKENWWSRSGIPEKMPIGEPGGPDSEMFFDFDPLGNQLDHPNSDTARFLELGNNVFMSYQKTELGFVLLDKPNIDYGGGLERIAAAVNCNPDTYLTSFFTRPRLKLVELTGRDYENTKINFRIILDHTRAATFLIGDGVLPSNVDAGYITRRLMRRAIRVGRKIGLNSAFMMQLAEIYIDEAKSYPELAKKKADILAAISKEEKQFQITLHAGEREMKKYLENKGEVTGKDAFYFYETFGFPIELTEEFLSEHNTCLVDREAFEVAAEKHSAKSRSATTGKFKGGLADHSESTTALHTATHLLLAALRNILGDHVHQKGSNITTERIRFDFNHHEKISQEQKQMVEEYVNQAINADAKMMLHEMPKQQAKNEGVEGSFWEKYPDIVKVYVFQDNNGQIWSKELCGGPHVKSTGELGKFIIKKEESCAAGVRRIKAILQKSS